MNRDQKTAVVEEVAAQIEGSEAVFAVDYRGISVPQAADLRQKLNEAGARFRVVKNTLTLLAADKAGADDLKGLLEGPTAFTFVTAEGGDVALAAKALAQFRREHDLLDFKGGRMNGESLTIEQIEDLARLPGVEVLHGQLVGTLASPVTGLVRGLNQLIAGLAQQLGQIADQGLVSGEAPVESDDAPAAAADDDAPTPDHDEADQQDGEDHPVDAEESAQDDAADDEAAGSAGEGGDEETSSEEASPQDDETDQEG